MGKILSAYLCPHPPIIINEIGRGKEVEVKDTIDSLENVAKHIKDRSPDTIIVITPHGPVFKDAIAIGYEDVLHGDMSGFGVSDITFNKSNNKELVDIISSFSFGEGIYTVKVDKESSKSYGISYNLDHGTLVPLYFVDKYYKDYKLIHITYGLLSPMELYKFGISIQQAIEEYENDVVIIGSGDLSHRLTEDGPYEYNPKGKEFDEKIINLLNEFEVENIIDIDKSLVNEAGECGLRSIYIMLGALDGFKVDSKILSYEGTFGVGYGVGMFEIVDKDSKFKLLDKINKKEQERIYIIRKNEDEYVSFARKALETYILDNKVISLNKDLSNDLLNQRAGVFVSIKKDGELRGCIGTILPTTSCIAQEIVENAIKAGTEDPRFYPIDEDELDVLVYSVDVLMKPEKITSKKYLNVLKYGVIVSSGNKRGLLLPNLEGVNTVDKQLEIVLSKAGISKNENYEIERFEVIRHT